MISCFFDFEQSENSDCYDCLDSSGLPDFPLLIIIFNIELIIKTKGREEYSLLNYKQL